MSGALRPLLGLLLLGSSLWATPPLTDRATLWLNKPGTRLEPVPSPWLERERERVGADDLSIGIQEGVGYVTIVKAPRTFRGTIVTNADIGAWFTDKECTENWEVFHGCLDQNPDTADGRIYCRLERGFVAKVQCRKGCDDPSFGKWRFRWPTPACMSLEADIGTEGGFLSVEEARRSLHAINALLKRLLYGARFPEDFGEGRTPCELFSFDRVGVQEYSFKRAAGFLLRRLVEAGYLHGIGNGEINKIEKRMEAGTMVYYVPPGCADAVAGGWRTLSNSARIRFDGRRCPHVAILR